MQNADLVIQIILMILGSGFLGHLSVWLHKHHKANKTANALDLAQKFTRWTVAQVATDSQIPIGQRKKLVAYKVQALLNKRGFHVDLSLLLGLAQEVYNLYKKSGHKIVAPEKTPAPTDDKTTDGPKTTHPVSNLSDDELNMLNKYRENKANA